MKSNTKLWAKCEDCKFWMPDDIETSSSGRCHRYAPRPIVTKDEDSDSQLAYFPITWDDEWCGEFVKFTGEW